MPIPCRRTSTTMRIAVPLVLGLCLLVPEAWATRPTPHGMIDEALAPVRRQLEAMHATDAERTSVADLVAQAEQFAVAAAEARARNDSDAIHAEAHHIELLTRAVQSRIEAVRLEARANDLEQAAL